MNHCIKSACGTILQQSIFNKLLNEMILLSFILEYGNMKFFNYPRCFYDLHFTNRIYPHVYAFRGRKSLIEKKL